MAAKMSRPNWLIHFGGEGGGMCFLGMMGGISLRLEIVVQDVVFCQVLNYF